MSQMGGQQGGQGGTAAPPAPAPSPPPPDGGSPLSQMANAAPAPKAPGPSGANPIPGLSQVGEMAAGLMHGANNVATSPLRALASFGRGLQPPRRNYIMGAPQYPAGG